MTEYNQLHSQSSLSNIDETEKNTKINLEFLSKHSSIDTTLYHNVLLSYRPTRCDIIQCQDLLRLTLDISYNNLGGKGANILCQLLKNRLLNGNIGNYTIVSLSLAGNNFDVINLSNILQNLHCCICLESLNISDNIKQNIFTNNITKLTKSKQKQKNKGNNNTSSSSRDINEGLFGKCLVDLCRKATNLERLILNSNDLSIGLEPFLKCIAYLSNLKFIDLSNNKFNDKHIFLLITSLSYNRTFIRALIIGGNNKISSQCLIEYLQLLSNHTSLIDVHHCLPIQHILKYIKVKKYSATFTRLQKEASITLRDNKSQYDIDKKMVHSLPIRERLEKILRLQCGQQFGIPLESIRGTIKFIDYQSRIPKILINLRNYLKSKGGFKTKEIFRFHADSTQFQKFKQDLNANNKDAKTDDTHSIANAIKAFYHDLPIKVLNNVNINILQTVSSTDDVSKVIKLIKEPYRSLFEWLLDLCVDIVTKERINKMTHRSMAVVLCPSLYNACTATPKILRSVMEFTDYGIQWRIKYRKKYPAKYEEEIIQDPNINNKLKKSSNNYLNECKTMEDVVAYQNLVNKWNSVMKEMKINEIEQQSWNNCNCINDDDDIDEKHENGGNNVKFCYCIDRLTFILSYYKKWIKNRQINPHRQSTAHENMQQLISKYNHRMSDFLQCLSNYNNIQLINDFNHILRYHSSNQELEDITINLKQAMGGCSNISQCIPMIRNNRNRDRDENRPYKMKIYFGYKDSMELCTQQILDKIHCYFFHTFDTLRLSIDEQRKINISNISNISSNKSNKSNKSHSQTNKNKDHYQIKTEDGKLRTLKDILSSKSEKLGQIRGLHRVKGTKFSSNISTFIQRINNNNNIDIDIDIDSDYDDSQQSQDDEDDEEEEEEEDDIYTIGQSFDYWDGSRSPISTSPISRSPISTSSIVEQQANDWYVSKKYNNFKEEMLHNSIRQIACDSWNDCYAKALILQKSTIAKQIKYNNNNNNDNNDDNNNNDNNKPMTPTPNSPNSIQSITSFNSTDIVELKEKEKEKEFINIIPIQHIMAILLYCDFDNLRLSLNDTYYPQSITESITNWKLRHAEYCHWSEYLREAVINSNGINIGNNNNNLMLYHSTTDKTFLSPSYLKFCYPISCNPHLSTVYTFSPKNGIIFELKGKGKGKGNINGNYFNCSWISDYANYDEYIIFGINNNDNIYIICNIINIRTSQNYKPFWNAINILYQIVNGGGNNIYNQYDEDDMYCLSLLIESQIYRNDNNNGYNRSMSSLSGSAHRRRGNIQRLISPYIDGLFNTFCKDYILGQITIIPSQFISLPIIYKHLFDNFGWIKIDLFCNLFINIDCIQIINIILNDNIFDNLSKFLSQFSLKNKRRGAIQKRKSSVLEMIGSVGSVGSNQDHQKKSK